MNTSPPSLASSAEPSSAFQVSFKTVVAILSSSIDVVLTQLTLCYYYIAATLLLFNGDILGASGIMSSFVVTPKSTLTDPSNQWKLCFVVSFFIVSRVFLWVLPSALDDVRTSIDTDIPIVSPLGFILGGFFVGFGTRLGNGCTSGHGICGLARLSIRSMVGIMSFMITGILFASVVPASNPHIRDTPDAMETYAPTTTTSAIVTVIVAIVGISALVGLTRKIPSSDSTEGQLDELTNNRQKILPSIGGAILFAIGLFISQMTVYSKIFGFLDVRLIAKGNWDPTLVMVMGGGFIVSFVSYQWVNGHNIITVRETYSIIYTCFNHHIDTKNTLTYTMCIFFSLFYNSKCRIPMHCNAH